MEGRRRCSTGSCARALSSCGLVCGQQSEGTYFCTSANHNAYYFLPPSLFSPSRSPSLSISPPPSYLFRSRLSSLPISLPISLSPSLSLYVSRFCVVGSFLSLSFFETCNPAEEIHTTVVVVPHTMTRP